MNMRQLIPNPVRRVIPNPIKQLPWRLKWARSTAAYADAPFAALTRLAEWTFLECIRVRCREPKLLVQPRDQIARPPAHHAVDRRDRTLSTIRARKALCVASSLGGTPGEGMLMRPSGPCSVRIR